MGFGDDDWDEYIERASHTARVKNVMYEVSGVLYSYNKCTVPYHLRFVKGEEKRPCALQISRPTQEN